jgi:hypothetical protein
MSAQREIKPADIILQQMGGSSRLKAMIGARDFFSDDNGQTLLFKFMKGKNGATCIRITLDPGLDLYTVKFIKIGRRKDETLPIMIPFAVTVSEHEGIYCDMLRDLFTSETGLYLSL